MTKIAPQSSIFSASQQVCEPMFAIVKCFSAQREKESTSFCRSFSSAGVLSRRKEEEWKAVGVLKGAHALPCSLLHLLTVWNRNDGKMTSSIIALNWMRLRWMWQGASCTTANVIRPTREVFKERCSAVLLNVTVSFFLCLSTHKHTLECKRRKLHCYGCTYLMTLYALVKISPFDTANWSTCQRMFSSLVNHICPLISPHYAPSIRHCIA